MNRLLHTPEGVRDIYGDECKKKLEIQKKLHSILELYSYKDIQTPSFEFFDIFNREKGTIESREMYKFFDRENNTLVLRPDITPSIARCVSKYYQEQNYPIRLSYLGNTFINSSSYQGKLKETTQMGAELVGEDSSSADAEVIAMVIDSFLAVGLKDFQVEIGQVDYFRGLMEEGNVDNETTDLIRNLINNKNFFGLEQIANSGKISENIKEPILKFTELYGGLEMLEMAKKITKNERSLKAIERLYKLYNALSFYGYDKYISFDLAMLSNYNYYTGVIFAGYTYDTGDVIAKGGRYNNLIGQFGKEMPSVGYAIVVDELLLALSRQKIEVPINYTNTLILYDRAEQSTATLIAKQFRSKGISIELVRKSSKKTVEDYIKYAKFEKIDRVLYFSNSENVKEFKNDEINIISVSNIMEDK